MAPLRTQMETAHTLGTSCAAASLRLTRGVTLTCRIRLIAPGRHSRNSSEKFLRISPGRVPPPRRQAERGKVPVYCRTTDAERCAATLTSPAALSNAEITSSPVAFCNPWHRL